VAAPIPSSTEIAAATNAGKPIVLANPDHPASRALRQLAATLAEKSGDHHPIADENATDGDRKGRRLRRKK
jgi:pilus assembly protein CpaE